MVSNNHTCQVRDASDDFPHILTLLMLPFLGLMGGGYLVVSIMREDSMSLPLLGHIEGGFVYVPVTLMSEGDPTTPLQAFPT